MDRLSSLTAFIVSFTLIAFATVFGLPAGPAIDQAIQVATVEIR